VVQEGVELGCHGRGLGLEGGWHREVGGNGAYTVDYSDRRRGCAEVDGWGRARWRRV
jgi:hypothetical protein